jgi:membrane fusion protein (multidrug efflux system)
LQASYGVVRAPQSGVVTKVENLQVGTYVTAATPVFHLVADRVWIEADFKENQLKNMRIGQHATVRVDAYPGHELSAVVQSLAPGTDQTFSLLPAENSSGNWVKVVQRLPVRLAFDKPPPIALQGGLSAKVKVDTGVSRLGGGRPR